MFDRIQKNIYYKYPVVLVSQIDPRLITVCEKRHFEKTGGTLYQKSNTIHPELK